MKVTYDTETDVLRIIFSQAVVEETASTCLSR